MSPFDGRRFARLLEGLDAIELRLSDIQKESSKLRIDSGYYAKSLLAAEHVVRAYPGGHDEVGEIFSRFAKGIFDINASAYVDDGVPFLRILNLKNGVIDEGSLAHIPESIHQQEHKTALKEGDIVLSKTAYPAAALVTIERCNTSQDTIATSLSNYGLANYLPEVLVSYLNSSFGSQLLGRQFQGNVQLHLSLDDGRKVPVPRFGKPFQKSIALSFQRALDARREAWVRLAAAQSDLTTGLNLAQGLEPEQLTYSRRSGTVFSAGRLDAEYFTPRVTSLMQLLGKDRLTLQDVAPARHDRFLPKHTKSPTFQYIEIGDVRSDGSAESSPVAVAEAPSRATQVVRAGDVLTSTVRPIRRLSAVVADTQDKAVCSSGFVVLSPQSISADTLLTYLRLPLFCELMDLHTSASLYPAISERDLMALPIPLIPSKVQAKVDAAMASARAHKQKSAALLQAAQQAVELAIDKSEAAAMAYLRQAAQAWD